MAAVFSEDLPARSPRVEHATNSVGMAFCPMKPPPPGARREVHVILVVTHCAILGHEEQASYARDELYVVMRGAFVNGDDSG